MRGYRREAKDFIRTLPLFNRLEELTLNLLVSMLEQVDMSEGAKIYEDGAEARSLFLVMSGQVKLILPALNEFEQDEHYCNMERGDLFGYEVAETNAVRLTAAVASKQSVLLRLDITNLPQVLALVPDLQQRLNLSLRSLHLGLRVPLDWLEPEEGIFFIARRHPAFLIYRLIPEAVLSAVTLPFLIYFAALSTPGHGAALAFLIIFLLGLAGWIIWNVIDWSNDYAIITNERAVFQEQIIMLYDSRQEAPVAAIRSTDQHTNAYGRWLGYGDVLIRTFAGDVTLPNLAHYKEVLVLLDEIRARTVSLMDDEDRVAFRLEMQRRLSRGTLGEEPAKTAGSPAQGATLRQTLSNLLRMRFENGGVITYRTHWLMLIRKAGPPLLVTLLVFSGLLVVTFGKFTTLPVPLFIVWLLILFLGVFSWLLYQVEDWRNDMYIITPEQVVDVNKKPLGREDRRAASLRNIETVRFQRQNFIAQVFNYGTVFIRIGTTELTFDDVYNPSDVQREIFKRKGELEQREKTEFLRQQRNRTANYLEEFRLLTGQDLTPGQLPQDATSDEDLSPEDDF